MGMKNYRSDHRAFVNPLKVKQRFLPGAQNPCFARDESDDENTSSDSSLQSHQPEMTSTGESLVPPDHSTEESSQQDKSSTTRVVGTSKIKCGSSVSFELKGK